MQDPYRAGEDLAFCPAIRYNEKKEGGICGRISGGSSWTWAQRYRNEDDLGKTGIERTLLHAAHRGRTGGFRRE